MRTTLLCILIFTVISCQENQRYYHGFIFDENLKPLSGVTVTDSVNVQWTTSIEKGYFRLYRDVTIISDLTFSKPGFETKTVETTRTSNGKTKFRFLNINADTLILKRIALPNNGDSNEKQ